MRCLLILLKTASLFEVYCSKAIIFRKLFVIIWRWSLSSYFYLYCYFLAKSNINKNDGLKTCPLVSKETSILYSGREWTGRFSCRLNMHFHLLLSMLIFSRYYRTIFFFYFCIAEYLFSSCFVQIVFFNFQLLIPVQDIYSKNPPAIPNPEYQTFL